MWIRLNGERCYLWSSNWSPFGNIKTLVQAEGSLNITNSEDDFEWWPETTLRGIIQAIRNLVLTVWQASMYLIWIERNSFRSSASVITKYIDLLVRNQISQNL